MAQYAATVRDVAEGLGVVLVDHAAAWSRAAKSRRRHRAGRMAGRRRPSRPRGHHAMVRTLLEALDLADPASAVTPSPTTRRSPLGLRSPAGP